MIIIEIILSLKLAYRNLVKRPIRTILTLISITLGVSIFFSVNVATDSLAESLYSHLDTSSLGDVDQWIYLFRGILMVLSGISLIICMMIIKNLMEMAKENQLYELGVLRSIGVSKSGIFMIFFFQVVIISFIGVQIGLIFGTFLATLFFGPLKSILATFLGLATEFEVVIFISPLTIFLSIITGFIIPLIFGMIPSISAARIRVLQALHPYLRRNREKVKSFGLIILQVIISITFLLAGILIINIGFQGLLSFTSNPTYETNFSIILLFLAGLVFIIGILILTSLGLPKISSIFSYIFYPLLRKIRSLVYRNIKKYRHRSKNTFLMISIVLSFLITIRITLTSIDTGVIPGAHMRIGGDIRLGMYYSWSQTQIPLSTSNDLLNIEHVNAVCEVKNSYWSGDYTMIDNFGNFTDENMILYVINISSYIKIHSQNSIYKIKAKDSFKDYLNRLNSTNTIFLQGDIKDKINKDIGDKVQLTTKSTGYFPEVNSTLDISGYFDVLPGIYQSWEKSENSYNYAGVISWNTYFEITGSNKSSNTGYFWIKCDDPNNSEVVFNEIKNFYNNSGLPWNQVSFENTWSFRTILDEIEQINTILNLILIIISGILYMGLIIAMLGISISMIMNIRKRSTEIGIMRSIGFSKLQIIRLVFGELFLISLISILVGILSGITTGYLLSNVPFMPYVPFIFNINWWNIFIISMSILLITMLGSIIPSIQSLKLNIIRNIRNRGL